IDDSVSLGRGVSIHPGVIIEEQAVIGDDVIIAPGSYVGQGVEIGAGTVIHPCVVIEYGTIIGENVIIQAGTVIGGDGFGYVSSSEGHTKIPQLGQVIVEDDVEIGANVCIDRAVSDKTIIGKGTKIDNLVQVGHNVKIGPENLITGQVGIAGSSETGKRVTLAGQVGVSDHVSLGDNITVGARGLVVGDLDKPGMYSGVPVQKHKKELREKAACRRIPKLMKKIKKLEKEMAKLKKGE
ncbi:MAG: UDP-3-O-(3-hydroxymyristoyl)glucosamine N-acyltransferase, partial [Bacillota bacterium]